jgi:hypothetical protein
MADNQVELIKKNAELVIKQLGPLSGIEFGLNRASVEWVEGFIERQRAREDFDPDAGNLDSVLGSFLGECIIANARGEWQSSDLYGWGIAFSGDDWAFPFAKVEKAFRNGVAGGDSILSFYDTTVDFLATGKLGTSYRE